MTDAREEREISAPAPRALGPSSSSPLPGRRHPFRRPTGGDDEPARGYDEHGKSVRKHEGRRYVVLVHILHLLSRLNELLCPVLGARLGRQAFHQPVRGIPGNCTIDRRGEEQNL